MIKNQDLLFHCSFLPEIQFFVIVYLPQAWRWHAGIQAWVCIKSGVYRKRVHEVERSGRSAWKSSFSGNFCKRNTRSCIGGTTSSFVCWCLFFLDDRCWNAGTDSWRNHQKGAVDQRSPELQVQWQRHRGCESVSGWLILYFVSCFIQWYLTCFLLSFLAADC